MRKIGHGEALPPEFEEAAPERVENPDGHIGALPPEDISSWPFKYLFPDLAQDDKKILLSSSGQTVKDLSQLGSRDVMLDRGKPDEGVPIPTVYTFFGQFVDHDITHEKGTHDVDLSSPNLQPLEYKDVLLLRNSRSPNLELDSIYGSTSGFKPPLLADNKRFRIDPVDKPEGLPPHTTNIFNDLPRAEPNADPKLDRVALIGDVRNDENIITAQLHLAFLYAHNALIDQVDSFEEARRLLIRHYQWIVLYDYLPRITNPKIFRQILNEGAKFFKPTSREELFTPLEFSAAAYRFGHSKIRAAYNGYNRNQAQQVATLDQLFTFSRFGGPLGGPNFKHIPGTWVIDWKNFLNAENKKFFSRPIDTTLTAGLFALLGEPDEQPIAPWKTNLALRNLLRGYFLRLPTGQAIAEAMQKVMPEIEPLPPDVIKWAVPKEQRDILESTGFLKNTPLWFYILAEAKVDSCGRHLGPVGTVIVAETLIGMLRFSDESILQDPTKMPSLPSLTPGQFTLEDLLRFAGVYRP